MYFNVFAKTIPSNFKYRLSKST